jgi:hypothetical protein
MGPELVWQAMIMRVDGGVLEVFTAGADSRRTSLRWPVVRVEPVKNDRVRLTIGSKSFRQVTQNVDPPLYAWGKLDGIYQQQIFTVDLAEELTFRAFFARVAQLSGRPLAQAGQL